MNSYVVNASFALLLALSGLAADEPPESAARVPRDDECPKKIELHSQRPRKAEKVAYVTISCHPFHLSEENLREFTTSLVVEYNFPGKEDMHDGSTQYNIPGQGEVFPLATAIYRVAEIKVKPKRKTISRDDMLEGSMRLERIDEKWAVTVAPKKDSFVIHHNNSGGRYGTHIAVVEIFKEQNSPIDFKDVVKIETPAINPTKESRFTVLVLKEGETFDVKNPKSGEIWRHTIRRIVPNDYKPGLKGWVEIDLNGVKVTEGKKSDDDK